MLVEYFVVVVVAVVFTSFGAIPFLLFAKWACAHVQSCAAPQQIDKKKIKTQRIVSLANIYHTTVGFRRFIWNSAKEKPNIKSPLTTDYWLLQMTASAMDTICYWLIRSISWYWAICYSKRVFDFCSKL